MLLMIPSLPIHRPVDAILHITGAELGSAYSMSNARCFAPKSHTKQSQEALRNPDGNGHKCQHSSIDCHAS